MKYIYIYFLIFTILTSCLNQPDSVEYYNVGSINCVSKQIVSSVTLDTINIHSDIESSFIGYYFLKKDTLHFADLLFNYVYRFNLKGEMIDKNLGKGFVSKDNINGFHNSDFNKDKYFFINERNSEVTVFNNKFKRLFDYKINWQINRSREEVLKNPKPNKGDTYEFDFGNLDNFKIWDEDHFAIPITTSHPNFNGYFNTEEYYRKSRILALIDIKTGNVVDLIGRRSPELLSYNNLPNFDHFNFELDSENLFVNFWCDSLIYIINKTTKKPINKFGFKGKNMKTDYYQTIDYQSAHERWQADQLNFGRYSYLKYFEKEKLLFRGYKKGGQIKNDGLQIYKNNCLVGDLEVPNGLRIIGNYSNTFIGFNENENNTLRVFKITLNYENNI